MVQRYLERFMTETQNGFRKVPSCTDPTFFSQDFNWKTKVIQFGNTLFIDYKKAFGIIQRQMLLDILESQIIPNTLLKAIVDLHMQKNILIKFNSKLSKRAENNTGVLQARYILKYEIITK